MKKLFKMLLFLTVGGVFFGCSSDTDSSTCSDNSTTTNTSTSVSCSDVNDGFINMIAVALPYLIAQLVGNLSY